MSEQYVTLVGKVCAPRYEEVYTPEVKSKLPIEASSEGRKLKDYTIYGNNNPNHVDESQLTLPVSIDTYGGNAVDWEIYGNNNPVVENKTGDLPIEVSATAGNAVDYTIYGNDDNGTENLFDGNYQATFINTSNYKYSALNGGRTAVIQCDPNTQYTISVWSGCNRLVVGEFETEPQINDTTNILATYTATIPQYTTITTGANVHYIACYVSNQNNAPTISIVKGSIAPDHYIPYQQGVGENTKITGELPIDFRSNGDDLLGYRIYGTADGSGVQTENLLPNVFRQGATNNFISNNRITAVTSILCSVGDTFSVKAEAGFKCAFYLTNEAGYQQFVTDTSFTAENRVYDSGWRTTFTKTITETQAKCIVIMVAYSDDSNLTPSDAIQSITLVKGSIPPETYIPNGYKIPLTVASSTESKVTDIYIGNSKLGAEEYVDYEEQKVYKRTENSFDENSEKVSGYINAQGELVQGSFQTYTYDYFAVEPSSEYSYKAQSASFANRTIRVIFYTDSQTFISRSFETNGALNSRTITTPSNCHYVRLSNDDGLNGITFVNGSDAPETYIPYIQPTDPPLPLPAIETVSGENTLDSTIEVGETMITQGYRIPLDIRHKTKNLLNITGYNRTHYGVQWYEDNGQFKASGTYTDSAAHTWPRFYVELSAGTYTLSGSPNYEQSGVQVQIGKCTDAQGSNFSSLGYDTGSGYTFTLQADSWVSVRVYTSSSLYQQTVDLTLPLMLRLADTSTDFEPYYLTNHEDIYIGSSPLTQGQTITKTQSNVDLELFSGDNIIDTTLANKPQVDLTYRSSVLGVGERTKNLVDLSGIQPKTAGNVTLTPDYTTGFVTCTTTGGELSSAICAIPDIYLPSGISGNYYLSGCPNGGSESKTYDIYPWDETTNARPYQWDGVTTARSSTDDTPQEVQFIKGHTYRIGVRVRSGQSVDGLVFKPMIRPADTTSNFIPCGYQIPISVTSGQQSTPHTIYIGSAPLTEGQSVSKTSTGTEIALYQGENTISTTLGNKPETRIDYLSTEVGVGERTKNFVRAIVGVTSSGVTYTVDSVAGTVTANGTATGTAQIRIAINYPDEPNNTTVPPGNYYFSGCPSGGSGNSYNCYSWDYDTAARSKQWDGTTNVETDLGQGNCQVQINGHRQSIILRIAPGYTANNVVFKPMLRKADAISDFEPYGYQLPIDIKQGDEVVDHKDIYIGTQPLVEGASVSKVSVGEDITLANGNNYIDTDLFNKPEMYIK